MSELPKVVHEIRGLQVNADVYLDAVVEEGPGDWLRMRGGLVRVSDQYREDYEAMGHSLVECFSSFSRHVQRARQIGEQQRLRGSRLSRNVRAALEQRLRDDQPPTTEQ